MEVSESDGSTGLFCSIGVLNTTLFGLDAEPSFRNIPLGLSYQNKELHSTSIQNNFADLLITISMLHVNSTTHQ